MKKLYPHTLSCQLMLYLATMMTVLVQPASADWVKIEQQEIKPIKLEHDSKVKFPNLPNFKDHTLSVFAMAPEINCPVSVVAEPTGALLVFCDRNAGLGLDPNRGTVFRLIDENDDGKADFMTKFIANVDTPRGGHFLDGVLYMVHPPFIAAYRDIDGDGVADEKKILAEGLGHDLSWRRGGDHTTNDLRVGLDGWLYIAVGDFGVDAIGSDGTKVKMMHGGVIRMRRDGSDMHIYARGTRNTYDLAINHKLDILALDNTNDGDGWDMRLHHLTPLAHMGYPELYKFFSDDAMHPLYVFGGGSGVGALYLEEPQFPDWINNRFHTNSWGKMYTHELKPNEATFISKSTLTLGMNKMVDLDVDGSSRLYFNNFEGGGARVSKDAVVGRVVQAKPKGWQYRAFPDLKKASVQQLLAYLDQDSAVLRQNAQMALIKRKKGDKSISELLFKFASASKHALAARIAALYAINLRNDPESVQYLKALHGKGDMTEFALRALIDRQDRDKLKLENLVANSLDHKDPRVKLQAIVGMQKLGHTDHTARLLELSDPKNDPRPDLTNGVAHEHYVIPHTARRALIDLAPLPALHDAINAPSLRRPALAVLRQIHSEENINGLIAALKHTESTGIVEHKLDLITVLLRLYTKEHDWDSNSWWGTRPNSSGPYFQAVKWEKSETIAKAIRQAVSLLDESAQKKVLFEVRRHSLDINELKLPIAIDPLEQLVEQPSHTFTQQTDLLSIVTNKSKPEAMRVKAFQAALDVTGFIYPTWCFANLDALKKIEKEKELYQKLSRDFVHSPSHGSHIGRLVKAYPKIRKYKDAQRSLYYEALCVLAQSPLTKKKTKDEVISRVRRSIPANKLFIESILKHRATAYLPILKQAARKKEIKEIAQAAIKALTVNDKQLVGSLPFEDMKNIVLKTSGDPEEGKQLFMRQSCIACHTVSPTETVKGPYLGAIGNLYNREQLITHVAQPEAEVAQGFQAYWFKMKDGVTVEGFVTSRNDKTIELRNIVGMRQVIDATKVTDEGVRKGSMMPAGLVNALTLKQFASLIDYLESMH